MSETVVMLRSFAYLQGMTLVNGVRQRVRRLRQPKYLFGALFGAAYVYYFAFRHLFDSAARHPGGMAGIPASFVPLLLGICALLLMIFAVLSWLLPGSRAALQFSEPEVAFLFPAPLTRVGLIQFSLLRSQLGIFASAFIMTLLLRRGASSGGTGPVLHAFALWLLLATIKLHLVGASFARERLLDFGVRPMLRRVLGVALVVLVAAACWWWMRATLRLPTADDIGNGQAFALYAGGILATPPLDWLLAIFKIPIAPFLAPDRGTFLRALVPAALLLVAHYVWVVRSHVSFEEASMDRARQRAERRQARRDGNFGGRRGPSKPRSEPFRLAPAGFTPLAFLWKGLIAAGPFWRLRSFLIGCAVVVAGGLWMGADPARRVALQIVGSIGGMICAYVFLAGPMFLQRSMRRTIESLDVLKATPVRGWQIAMGELLTPLAMMSFAQWLGLLLLLMAFVPTAQDGIASASNMLGAAAGFALLVLPLGALMLCVPFTGMVLFPAWAATSGGRDAGIEVMGQRLIFFGAYLIVLVLAMLPAALVGGLVFLLVRWLAVMPAALALGGWAAAAVLAIEFGAAVWWLGGRIDRIDVAQELR